MALFYDRFYVRITAEKNVPVFIGITKSQVQISELIQFDFIDLVKISTSQISSTTNFLNLSKAETSIIQP